jgi:hypothetical protein
MLLGIRKPKCVVLKSVPSTSGKYKLFYGYHYLAGKTCYDVGTINQQSGEIITRHYLDQLHGNPKAEALRCYHEFEKAMTRPAASEETEESALFTDAFRRALNNSRWD